MKLTWKPLAAAGVAIVLLIGLIAAVAGKSGASSSTGSSSSSKAVGATGAGSAAAVTPPVVEAWKNAGLTVSSFTPADGKALGGDCASGTAGGVDVTLCTYPDEATAKKAEDKGLAVVGETTGVSIAAGSTLLIAADRRKADPSGRTINQLAKLFRGGSLASK
jgi:hypothetical protein